MSDREQLIKLSKLLGLKVEVNTGDTAAIDACLEFAYNTAKEIVINYCNIDEIPESLGNTVIHIAMDIYRNEQPGETTPQAVKSLSIGDTTTGFGTVSSASYEESILKDYRKQLNRFRKVVF